MNKPESILKNEMHKILWDFEIQTDHLIPARIPDLVIINKKKGTCHIVNFAYPADYRVKMKESKKRAKCLDLGRELRRMRNMRVIVILIAIVAFGTVHKGLEKEQEELVCWLGFMAYQPLLVI